MERITVVSESLETVTGGDLTAELSLISETDVMGKSLQKMLTSLNIRILTVIPHFLPVLHIITN